MTEQISLDIKEYGQLEQLFYEASVRGNLFEALERFASEHDYDAESLVGEALAIAYSVGADQNY